jgi:deazaflavin-dependent oxidoreductase (nitroreductase family)
MAKTNRTTFFVRTSNALVMALLRAGFNIGPNALLTVRGRKTGQPRTTPVAVIERNGQRYLVAPFGPVNWVLNLRAAGQAMLTRNRRSETIRVVELASAEAAPILKAGLGMVPGFIRAYFDATPDSPLADFEREAPRHPVFRVHTG